MPPSPFVKQNGQTTLLILPTSEKKVNIMAFSENTVTIMDYFFFKAVIENNQFTSEIGGTKHIRHTNLVTLINLTFLGGRM